jgi:hypothetical protein
MFTINGKIPIADTPEKKLRRLAMLVRAVSQAIEGSDAVSDTIWFTDTETACDALFRASDEIIDVADGLPNATDQRPGAQGEYNEQK